MSRRHAQFAVGFVVLLVGASFWMARVLPTAHVRALREARPATTDAIAAGRARVVPPASRGLSGGFLLFGLPYPVLARRIGPADARGVFLREWLLQTAENFGPVRVEEQVWSGATGNREVVLLSEAFVAGEMLVRPREGVAPGDFAAALTRAGAASWRRVFGSAYCVAQFASPDLDTKPRALEALARESEIVAVEGNGFGAPCDVPDDPRFSEQDSLQNMGQMGGRPGADISMTQAWEIRRTSPDVIVAVLDMGINYDHPDLAPNLFRDPREMPANGVDDDGNGFVDDWRGWDFVNNDNDPEPSGSHATGAASIIGARGNNGLAIAGITWDVQLLNVKVNDSTGGTTANLIAGINYARTKGARIMSMSLGGYPYSPAMLEAVEAARAADILLVIAAGNAGTDNDVLPFYPASYPSDNILAVANTNNLDELNLSASSYGLRSVDLGAPGTHLLGLGLEDGYRYGNGTSSATPHVAGVAALLRQMRPEATVADLRHWILDTVDPLPTLAGRCVSGGRLNAYAALRAAQILPTITTQPASQTVAAGGSATFRVTVEGRAPLVYQWRRNGADIPGATTASHTIGSVQSVDAGVYTVVVTDAGGALESQGAILALTTAAKVAGSGSEVGPDIRHPNGNVYDQVLLTGPAATITADAGQVTRLSYIDLSDDIVQVEFSGPGALTLTLENATGPAPPAKYNQAVSYMKGHATITLAAVTANSHVSIFTVGSLTAVDQTLFRSGETYDGVADVALLSIVSADGRFGGIRTGNAEFSGTRGLTGLNALGVQIAGPVNLHNLSASDTATPVLLTGPVDTGQIGVTGGDLYQPNGREIQVGGVQRIAMIAGATSHNVPQPAQANRGCCVCDGQDVTAQLVQNPGG